MKTKIILTLTLIAAMTGTFFLNAKEIIESESRTSNPYHFIVIKGNFDVTLIQNETPGITVMGTNSQVKNTVTMLKDDTLYVYVINESKSTKRTEVKINVNELNSLAVDGKSKVEGIGLVNSNQISIKADGGAEINLNVSKDKI
jgi:hypothetical protein